MSSNGQSIDTFGTGNPFSTLRGWGEPSARPAPTYMITPHFGIGAETDFRFSQGSYTGLTYRPMFYDFNAIWAPTGHVEKRVVPEIEAGLGGARLSFYYPSSYCDQFAGCSTSNSFVESSNHFQVHLSAGVRVYARRTCSSGRKWMRVT